MNVAPALAVRPVAGTKNKPALPLPAGRRVEFAAPGGGTATPGQRMAVWRDLAAALSELGVTVDENNLLAAKALVRFGVAVTGENLQDVRRGLASGDARLPETVALARSLGLPPSPAILRALDALLAGRADGAGAPLALDAIPVDPDTPSAAVADRLETVARAVMRSVENRLLAGDQEGARSDLRAHLILSALGGDADAEASARHLEGQMLVSAGRAHRDGADAPLFVAFTVASAGTAHQVEMQVRPDADDAVADSLSERGEGSTGAAAAATLRLPTAGLGLVTVRLLLDSVGRLSCHLSTPDAAAARRMADGAPRLEAALARAGFARPIARAEQAEVGDALADALPCAAAAQPLRALDVRA